ncbi:hypothetical protein C8Q75DRAFT_869977 [Abortiporus biennis]|nr:hypothetical protein C8Q75DRAFT_869977 [Abortiporus biennis]
MSTCNIRHSHPKLCRNYTLVFLNVLNESGYLSQMRVSVVIRPKLPQLSVAPYFGKLVSLLIADASILFTSCIRPDELIAGRRDPGLYSEIKNASPYPGTCMENTALDLVLGRCRFSMTEIHRISDFLFQFASGIVSYREVVDSETLPQTVAVCCIWNVDLIGFACRSTRSCQSQCRWYFSEDWMRKRLFSMTIVYYV